MQGQLKLALKVLLIIVLQGAFALQAKPPFPKVQKLYQKGRYTDCLEQISASLSKARGENLSWLYYMQMASYQALYHTEIKHDYLRKALNSARKLKQKSGNEFPEYTEDSVRRLKEEVIRQTARADKLTPKAVKSLEECRDLMEALFSDASVKWYLYEQYRTTDPERAEKILQDAVIENYRARKNGDTTDFLKGYLAVMDIASNLGALNRSMDVYLRAAEAYPGDDRLCVAARLSLEAVLNEYSMGRPSISEAAHRWIDTLGATGCANHDLQVHIWMEEWGYYTQTGYDADRALRAAHYLRSFSDTFSKEWFYRHYKTALTGYHGNADSVRLMVVFQLYNLNSNARKAAFLEQCGRELAIAGRTSEAYGLYQWMKRSFPTEATRAAALRAAISKQLLSEEVAGGKKAGLAVILEYYEINKTAHGTREQTIQRLVKLHDHHLIQGNYSQCMRITKAGLRLFPGEARLLKARKDWIIADMRANYHGIPQEADISGADIDKCREGVVTADYQKKFMNAFNCVRRVAGIYDSCSLNADMNRRSQKAALIMAANGELTHGPEKTAKCYSEEGARGAGSSNLSLGHNGIAALFGQLNDNGGGNYFVGHRRWILNPYNSVYGHGSCGDAMSLTVFGAETKEPVVNPYDPATDFVAWPSADYFPSDWLSSRWSFSLPKADLSAAKVSMWQSGRAVAIRQNDYVPGYGMNTIVWEPDLRVDKNFPATIKISNIKVYNSLTEKYEERTITYQVIIF